MWYFIIFALCSHAYRIWSRLPPAQPSFTPRNNPYPNPGFLGSSSHVAIFNEISPQDYHASDTYHPSEDMTMLMQSHSTGENILLIQGADVLRQLLNTFPLAAMKDFVTFWLATGANLALAEPFTEKCTENMTRLFTSFSEEDNWHLAYAQRLTQNSREPLQFSSTSDMETFSAQFLDQKFRWESLGIFLSAVSRAAIDISFFPPLFKTEKDQFVLRKLSTKLSDLALDIALSLDCLNDLQLVLQYENFIVHTHVDGDQSKNSPWFYPFKIRSSLIIQATIHGVDLEMLCRPCLHLATMRMLKRQSHQSRLFLLNYERQLGPPHTRRTRMWLYSLVAHLGWASGSVTFKYLWLRQARIRFGTRHTLRTRSSDGKQTRRSVIGQVFGGRPFVPPWKRISSNCSGQSSARISIGNLGKLEPYNVGSPGSS